MFAVPNLGPCLLQCLAQGWQANSIFLFRVWNKLNMGTEKRVLAVGVSCSGRYLEVSQSKKEGLYISFGKLTIVAGSFSRLV